MCAHVCVCVSNHIVLFAFRNLEKHLKMWLQDIYQEIIIQLCDTLTSSKPLTVYPNILFSVNVLNGFTLLIIN